MNTAEKKKRKEKGSALNVGWRQLFGQQMSRGFSRLIGGEEDGERNLARLRVDRTEMIDPKIACQ